MAENSTIDIAVRKDSKNVRFREYRVNQKISLAPHKTYTLPLLGITNEKLTADIGPIGASLVSMLNKIDALDVIYLSHDYVGISKKRGRDWTTIEQLVFLDIQTALGATAYRTKKW